MPNYKTSVGRVSLRRFCDKLRATMLCGQLQRIPGDALKFPPLAKQDAGLSPVRILGDTLKSPPLTKGGRGD